MLGVCLLYVGIVLINNGVCRLCRIDGKSAAVMNVFVGLLSVFLNALSILQGDFYGAATGLLFGFTYLFSAAISIWKLDNRPYGWFSLFVAINAVPAALICFSGADWRMGVIWLIWAVLWLTGFIETVLKKDLKNFVPYLAIFSGIVTAWIPGFLMLTNKW